METIKSVVGLGKKEQEGQEPVSGVKGAGDGTQPYDAGNADNSELGGKAPQETNPDQVTGQPTADTKPADEATASGKSEAPAPAVASEPTSTTTASAPSASNTSETSKENASDANKSATIGSSSWFKTALPFGKKKNEDKADEAQATAGALGASKAGTGTGHTGQDESKLPPNHLGENVPEGVSTDIPVALAETATSSKTAEVAPESQSASAEGVTTTQESVTDQTTQKSAQSAEDTTDAKEDKSKSGGWFSNPFGSNKRDDMEVPASAPKQKEAKEPHGSNPSAIPTAGGVALGARASEDRRKSRDARRSMSVPAADIPEADEKTQVNTTANADVGTTSKFHESESVANSPTVAKVAPSVQSSDAAGASNVSSTSDGLDKTTSLDSTDKDGKKRNIFSKVKEKIKH